MSYSLSMRNPQIKVIYGFLFAFILFLAIKLQITPYMSFATVSYLILITGYLLRKTDPKIHASLMTSAIMADFALVAFLETNRGAIKTALSFSLTIPQQAHIFFSSMATVLYVPTLAVGTLLLFKPKLRPRLILLHTRIATSALAFRTLGFIFMFSLLKHVNGRL